MRNALIGAGALVVAVLVEIVGARALRVEGLTPRVRGSSIAPAPSAIRQSGRIGDDRAWIGDAVITLTSLDEPQAPELVAISDADGWWSTEARWGRYRLAVFAAGYLPQISEIAWPLAWHHVTRLVRGGTTLRGRVLDLDGRAVAGARITVRDHERIAGVAHSGADGTFASTIAGTHTRITGHAPGYVDGEIGCGADELRLVPGVSLQGSVIRRDGEPCASVELVVASALGRLTTRADSFGRFELTVPRGELAVTAAGFGCLAETPLQLAISGPRSVQLDADIGGQATR